MQFGDVSDAATAVLLVGFVVAAVIDWRTREVDDRLWLGVAVVGGALQAVVLSPGGWLPVLLWVVVAAFAVQHLLPWDEVLFGDDASLAGYAELGLYVAVGVALFLVGLRYGVGSAGVPPAAIAVFVSVLVARGLFESGLLYGGADAKALMVAAVAVPIDAAPWFVTHASASGILAFYPFAITVLMNGALVAVVVPIALIVRNASRRQWNGWRTFTGYPLDVEELPKRFVWVADPTFHRDDSETSEDDQKERARLRDELRAKGIRTVWVTPQIPFVVLLAAGAILGVVVGNVLVDLLSFV
ncbi:MAG: hypothetical protein L3K01_05440 [Thermoplasmata archaeon]|nr:hypothetical protein [Thermoplasmata archaeon]